MPPEPETAIVAAADLTKAAPSPVVIGYIDGVRGARVFGWAWDQTDPAAVVEIELRLDGATLARAPADRPRRDLEKGGVGDGCHGFEIVLDEALSTEDGHRLQAFGHCPGLGAPVPLVNRTVRAKGARAATGGSAEDFRLWLGEFAAVQNNFEAALRAVAAEMRSTSERRSALAAEELRAVLAATRDLGTGLARVSEQLQGLEVFQARLDRAAAALTQAPADRGARAVDRSLWIAVGLLAALSTTALALGIWSVV
jgi:hypothetical protein